MYFRPDFFIVLWLRRAHLALIRRQQGKSNKEDISFSYNVDGDRPSCNYHVMHHRKRRIQCELIDDESVGTQMEGIANQNDAKSSQIIQININISENPFLLLNTSSACEVRRSTGPPCWSPSPARSSRASGPSWPCPSGACWPVLHLHHRTRTHPASTTPPT